MNDPRSRTVLVIGGGVSGNAVTVLLRRAGIAVELIEAKPDWNVLGSGITLQGNALRVLREVGVWDEVRESGYAVDAVGMAAPDGTVFHLQQDFRTGGDDLPSIFGMQRPGCRRFCVRPFARAARRYASAPPPRNWSRTRPASPPGSATAPRAATTSSSPPTASAPARAR